MYAHAPKKPDYTTSILLLLCQQLNHSPDWAASPIARWPFKMMRDGTWGSTQDRICSRYISAAFCQAEPQFHVHNIQWLPLYTLAKTHWDFNSGSSAGLTSFINPFSLCCSFLSSKVRKWSFFRATLSKVDPAFISVMNSSKESWAAGLDWPGQDKGKNRYAEKGEWGRGSRDMVHTAHFALKYWDVHDQTQNR